MALPPLPTVGGDFGAWGTILNTYLVALADDELDHTAFTATVNVTATTEATANTIVTASALTFDGSTVALIEFYSPDVAVPANAAGNNIVIVLYLDGASIGRWAFFGSSSNVATEGAANLKARLTPASGSRTYSVRAYRTNANGTVLAGTGGSGQLLPGFIRVSRVG